MPHPLNFRTQAEYYFRLAETTAAAKDKAQLLGMAFAWHRLAQELEFHIGTGEPRYASLVASSRPAAPQHGRAA